MRRLGAVPCGDGTVEAKVLRLRRGDATLVADFGDRRVEFSRG